MWDYLKSHWIFFSITGLAILTMGSIMFGVIPTVAFMLIVLAVMWLFHIVTE